MEQELWLVAGLGNPGRQYEKTWHNCGYLVLEVLSQRHQIALNRIRFKGLTGQGTIAGRKVILLQPTTYMNLSGESLREAMAFYKIPPQRTLVIYDDLDLPAGQIRMRPSGGAGTHNGMRSIIGQLGRQDFPRVRVGIGPLPENWELVSYVLSEIPQDQQKQMFETFGRAADAVEKTLQDGIEAAMNQANQKKDRHATE
ncbi:MAG: aminoacyl-tRNA hydrolase [Eubacteriales bacterium]|nr:aminoacyl-tRNA hydrolase [Eubacteriales bacterium]